MNDIWVVPSGSAFLVEILLQYIGAAAREAKKGLRPDPQPARDHPWQLIRQMVSNSSE
jgi:hypothetical protein